MNCLSSTDSLFWYFSSIFQYFAIVHYSSLYVDIFSLYVHNISLYFTICRYMFTIFYDMSLYVHYISLYVVIFVKAVFRASNLARKMRNKQELRRPSGVELRRCYCISGPFPSPAPNARVKQMSSWLKTLLDQTSNTNVSTYHYISLYVLICSLYFNII